jgi:DNA-binding IclR family transcriptional regulator
MRAKQTRPVAAVERALSLLAAFDRDAPSLSLTELSDRTGLYKSTLLRLADTLESYGYLQRTEDGRFQIGPTPLHLGALYQSALRPGTVIMNKLRALVEATGESAAFNVRHQKVRVCAYRVDSPNMVRDHIQVGDVLPLDRGAAGVVLSAFAKPHDPAYARMRRQLVASTSGEVFSDMGAVSAPVFDAKGELFGALVISGPRSHFDKATLKKKEEIVLRSAAQLTQELGGDAAPFEPLLAKPTPAAPKRR